MPKRKYSWNNDENSKIIMTNNNKKLNATLKYYLKIRAASAEMCGKEHTHRQNRRERYWNIFLKNPWNAFSNWAINSVF